MLRSLMQYVRMVNGVSAHGERGSVWVFFVGHGQRRCDRQKTYIEPRVRARWRAGLLYNRL